MADDERTGRAAKKSVRMERARGKRGEVSRPHTYTAAVHHATTGSQQLRFLLEQISCACILSIVLLLVLLLLAPLVFSYCCHDFGALHYVCVYGVLTRRVEHRIFRCHHVDMNRNLKLNLNFKYALRMAELLQMCVRMLNNKKTKRFGFRKHPSRSTFMSTFKEAVWNVHFSNCFSANTSVQVSVEKLWWMDGLHSVDRSLKGFLGTPMFCTRVTADTGTHSPTRLPNPNPHPQPWPTDHERGC